VAEETLPGFPPAAWLIAGDYAALGDLDECYRWLEKAAKSHFIPPWLFRRDPMFEPVRNDPRFQVLL
jgi:hypothetical protein